MVTYQNLSSHTQTNNATQIHEKSFFTLSNQQSLSNTQPHITTSQLAINIEKQNKKPKSWVTIANTINGYGSPRRDSTMHKKSPSSVAISICLNMMREIGLSHHRHRHRHHWRLYHLSMNDLEIKKESKTKNKQ